MPSGISIPSDAGNLKIGIRPRHVRFTQSDRNDAIRGKIQLVQEFGNARVATVTVMEEKLRVKINSGVAIPTGEVRLQLPEENLCIYADERLISRKR